jgi:hypothetical protein
VTSGAPPGMPSRPPPAARDQLLHLMDLNMWELYREMTRHARGGEIRETERLLMIATPRGVAWNNLVFPRAPIAADELLAAVRAFHGRRALPFAVYARAHADGALEGALRARGFTCLASNPGMVLLADPGTRCEPAGLVIRAATDDAGRRGYLRVSAEAYTVYGQPAAFAEDTYASLASVSSPQVQGFVGWVGDEPVAAATLYLTHGVAGIGEVGTVSAHRGRRYAEAVTWVAVREGLRRGAAFANLQASPMGEAVYARMGFTAPTAYRILVGPT